MILEPQLSALINASSQNSELKIIAEKVLSNQRISIEDGIYLFKNANLSFLATLANYVREKKNGNYVYFNRNFHVEPTNICVYTCSFCAYSRLIKQREEGWELSIEQMMDIIKKYESYISSQGHVLKRQVNFFDVIDKIFYRNIKLHFTRIYLSKVHQLIYQPVQSLHVFVHI